MSKRCQNRAPSPPSRPSRHPPPMQTAVHDLPAPPASARQPSLLWPPAARPTAFLPCSCRPCALLWPSAPPTNRPSPKRRRRREASLPSRSVADVAKRRCRREASLPSRSAIDVAKRRCRRAASSLSRSVLLLRSVSIFSVATPEGSLVYVTAYRPPPSACRPPLRPARSRLLAHLALPASRTLRARFSFVPRFARMRAKMQPGRTFRTAR